MISLGKRAHIAFRILGSTAAALLLIAGGSGAKARHAASAYSARITSAWMARSLVMSSFGDGAEFAAWPDDDDPLTEFDDTINIAGHNPSDGFGDTADAYGLLGLDVMTSQEEGSGTADFDGVAYITVDVTGPTGDYATDVAIDLHSNVWAYATADTDGDYGLGYAVSTVTSQGQIAEGGSKGPDPNDPTDDRTTLWAEVYMHDGHGSATFEIPIEATVEADSDNDYMGQAEGHAEVDLGVKFNSVIGP